METKQTIKFKDLSGWLKASVIITWIVGGIYALSFLAGFITGLLGW